MDTHGLDVIIISANIFLKFLVFNEKFVDGCVLDQVGKVHIGRELLGIQIGLLKSIFHSLKIKD